MYVNPSAVKEQLLRTPYGLSPDYPWGTAPFLSSGPGEITDGKGVIVNDQAAWNADPPGTVADEFDQSFRITLTDGCGNNTDYNLSPTFHFQMKKVDNGSWELERVN